MTKLEQCKCPYCGRNGLKCSICNGWMVKHGIYRGKQRYICRRCGKTLSIKENNQNE